MSRQYLRTFSLKFGVPDGEQQYIKSGIVAEPNTSKSNSGRVVPAKAVEATEIKFDCTIRRSAKGSGSKAEKTMFRLYNLAPESIAVLQQKGSVLILEAGYDGDNDLLYVGDISFVSTRRAWPETITTVETKDGGFVLNNTRAQITYEAKMSKAEIIRDMIGKLDGISIGTLAISQLENEYYQDGLSITGNLRDNLIDICRSEGYSWSINNSKISIKPSQLTKSSPEYNKLQVTGYKLTADYIQEIDWYYDNSKKLQDQKNVVRGVSFTTFLLPLTAEGVISIDYNDYTGDYSIIEVVHNLDSWGGAWSTQVQTEGV